MRGWLGFFIGLAVGGAVGVLAMLPAADEIAPTFPVASAADHAQCRAIEETLRAENEALTARLEAVESVATSGAALDASAAAEEASATATKSAETPEDAFRDALAKVRNQLRSVRDEEAGSAPVLALIEAWLKQAKDGDEMLAGLAGRALVYLAGTGKLRPEDVDGMAGEFRALRPGSAGRPGLAAAVARFRARGPKLATWLAGLPEVKEPSVRAAVVEALDESPSDAYREYLLKLSRTERDPEVLAAAWHEDPITVALTAAWAPRLIEAIEPRVAEGDLPPVVRGRALFAIGLVSVHEAAAANAAIGRLLATETDEGVIVYGRAVQRSIERDEANVQSLDALWAQHRRKFAEE